MDSIKQRDFYFDNLKFALIILVVVGHVIEPTIIANNTAKFIYVLIYSFHMPLFTFVSGYFSKNYKLHNLISRVAIPYVVFQVLYFFFDYYLLGGAGNKFTFFTPYWIMWYLMALFVWQLLLPIFKFKYSIIVALTIAVLAGYENVGYYLTMSRIIYFFPFFLIGYKFDKDKFFNLISAKYQRPMSAVGIILMSAALYFLLGRIETKFFYGSYPYPELNVNMWFAWFDRILLYGFTFLISIFFLYLIPASKNYFSAFGVRTLNVYLLHGFAAKLLILYGIYRYLNNAYGIWILILIGIGIAYILSLKIFDYIMKPLRLIKMEKLYET